MNEEEAIEDLLARLTAVFAEALAARVTAELVARQPPRPEVQTWSRRLLSLDQLVQQLPEAKRPETWKRWLYQRTRHGEIPGCHKIGGRLFFDAETTLAWLENGCTQGELAEPTKQSLHVGSDA